jgi:hypothetical protein
MFESAVRIAPARLGAETFEVLEAPENLAASPGFCWSPPPPPVWPDSPLHRSYAGGAKAVTTLDREGRTLTIFQRDSPPEENLHASSLTPEILQNFGAL